MSCYDKSFFSTKGFKYETLCEGLGRISLCKKSGNKSTTESRPSEKTIEELNINVNLEVGDLVAAAFIYYFLNTKASLMRSHCS